MRDVLIALLVLGIALNVAVLFVAVMARPGPVAAGDADASRPSPGPGPVSAGGPVPSSLTAGSTPFKEHDAAEPARAVAPEPPRAVAPEPPRAVAPERGGVLGPAPRSHVAGATSLSRHPDPSSRSGSVVSATTGFHATTVPATSTSVLAPVPGPAAELRVDAPAVGVTATGPAPRHDDQSPAAVPAPNQAADAAGRRRRFVLPRLEEDRARSDRAIAAVLGEIDTSRVTAPAVRRQRTRRVAGQPVPHTEVLLVGAERYAADFMYALARAMEQASRDSDRVQVLPEGSVRVLLEADPQGADAFVQRARALLGPWLQFAGVTVEFLVRPLEPAVATIPNGESRPRRR